MSRSTISTGSVPLSDRPQKSERGGDDPLHIAILGDFSARQSRTAENRDNLSDRRLLRINRDNFDEVFSRLAVELRIPVQDAVIRFEEMDELHPDVLYENLGIFEKLRGLSRKLKKKDKFDEALAELQQWSQFREQEEQPTEQAIDSGDPLPSGASLLEAALQGHDISQQLASGPVGSIDALIKDIVAPYCEAKTDPRQADMLAAVDDATSKTMRTLMHHGHFQNLEASWRSLYSLLRNIESDVDTVVHLLDVSKAELLADLQRNKPESQVFQQLHENRSGENDTPFAVVLADYQLHPRQEDIDLIQRLASLAAGMGAVCMSAGHESFAGCKDLSLEIDSDAWTALDPDLASAWTAVREDPSAAHFSLVAPRSLLRMPYGKSTSRIDAFDFEELARPGDHHHYLWGNGAYTVLQMIVEAFARGIPVGASVAEIGDRPMHVYQHDGDSEIKPCAEVVLSDRSADALAESGLLVLRSVRNKDAIRVANFRSIEPKGTDIRTLLAS